MDNQFTVDSLLTLLNTISQAGYGHMPIVIGEQYPLLKDALAVDYRENKLMIRNTYYNEKMEAAVRKAIDDTKCVFTTFIADCYKAGMMKEE